MKESSITYLSGTLKAYVQELELSFNHIPEQRIKQLKDLANYISKKRGAYEEVNLIFICTHNSRRSHFSHIWAQTAAAHYGIEEINCYSGGTEATAFNWRAVEAIKRAGFDIRKQGDGKNPAYSVRFSKECDDIQAYSKVYSDSANPQHNFSVVMTCSSADQNCPVIYGAEERFSLTFIDPKESDDGPHEKDTYDLRCRQIALEMFYIFSRIN